MPDVSNSKEGIFIPAHDFRVFSAWQAAPRWKQHGRRVWGRKAAHCMVAGSREGGKEPERRMCVQI